MKKTELRMYVLVNKGARMKPGKIAAQVGHAVQMVTEYMVRNCPCEWIYYKNYGMHPKIILKATEEEMEEIATRYKRRNARVWCVSVRDAGRTQVAPNTLTALAFCPLMDEEKPDELKLLKLL